MVTRVRSSRFLARDPARGGGLATVPDVTTRRFAQVDVFTSGAFTGNPVAVVLDADGLTDRELRDFARWTNLSETTFVLPPTVGSDGGPAGDDDPAADDAPHTDDALYADYRVRILTPSRELPFAGHPTLGTAHAWLEAGGVPKRAGVLVQECGVGLVTIRRGSELAFAAPPRTRTGPVAEDVVAVVAAGLGVERGEILGHQWVDNGPGWLAVRLATADRVRRLTPDVPAFGDLHVGVVGMAPVGSSYAYEVRAFITLPNPREDPVTGSLNASVAQWLRAEGLVPPRYVARQGSAVGAAGEVLIDDDGQHVWVGGRTATRISGTVVFDAPPPPVTSER